MDLTIEQAATLDGRGGHRRFDPAGGRFANLFGEQAVFQLTRRSAG